MYRTLLIAGIALLSAPGFNARRGKLRASRNVLINAIALFSVLLLCRNILSQLPEPTQWDFGGYYVYGLAGKEHLNFYKPLNSLKLPFHEPASQDFVEEVLNVGFPYPPPTMFLLWPFACLPYAASFIVWSGLQLLAIFVSAFFIHQSVRSEDGAAAPPYGSILALFCLWPPVAVSAYLGQSNAFVLLALSAAYRYRDRPISGVAMALGVFVKPWVAVVCLWPLAQRRWRVLAAGAATAFIAFSCAVLVFGAEIVRSYFSFSFTKRLPKDVLLDSVNESLLSTLKRILDVQLFPGSNAASGVFIVLAVVILGVSCVALLRRKNASDAAIFSLLIGLSLLLYPHSLEHYSSALVFPVIFAAFGLLEIAAGDSPPANLVFACVVAAICDFHEGSMSFGANLLVWISMTYSLLASRAATRGDDVAAQSLDAPLQLQVNRT